VVDKIKKRWETKIVFKEKGLNMIKTIIWDWNGTLLNDVDYNINVVNIMLKKRGIKIITKDKYRMLKKVPIKQFYIDIGINAANDNGFSEIIKEYWVTYNDKYIQLELNKNVENILQRIQKDGVRNYLLSLTNNKELIKQIDFFCIESYFEKIIGSSDSEVRNKIDKAKELIKKEKIDVKETLFIGDVINDYEVAERFGMGCILYSNGHQKIDRDKRFIVIENLDEIFGYL
jgi:phosphoglycolate phosphatase